MPLLRFQFALLAAGADPLHEPPLTADHHETVYPGDEKIQHAIHDNVFLPAFVEFFGGGQHGCSQRGIHDLIRDFIHQPGTPYVRDSERVTSRQYLVQFIGGV